MRCFAIEAAYYDFGQANAQGTVPGDPAPTPLTVNGELKSNGPALAVIGILPLGPISIDGRVGAYCGKTEATCTASADGVSSSASGSKSEATVMGGVGLAWIINDHWSLRLDYLYLDKVGDKNTTGQASVSVGTLGVRCHFL